MILDITPFPVAMCGPVMSKDRITVNGDSEEKDIQMRNIQTKISIMIITEETGLVIPGECQISVGVS